MRRVLTLAALAAALFANIPATRAQDGNRRWCAVVNIGFDSISETCIYRTIEECRPFVLAGNRGFCNENPRYSAEPLKRRGKGRVKGY
jgi:hypothetical protein